MRNTKKTVRKRLSDILLFFCLILFLVSSGKLLGYYGEYKKGEDIYEEITQAVEFPKVTEKENTGEETDKNDLAPVVDSDKLRSLNPDYAGWIYIEDTVINYPVVDGVDNDRYLHRTFTGERNSCGSIFLDMDCNKDFSSRHTILHGHNMKNKSMFGSLRYYNEKDYWKKHPYIWIVTPDKELKYEIFASCRTNAGGEIYQTDFRSDEDFQHFIDLCNRSREYDTGIKAGTGDCILTLSTCTSDTEEGRRIVQARLVRERELKQ